MTTISRISTYATHQRSMSDFNTVQSRLVDIQGQISSGVKAQNFQGLNGQVEQFTGLEATMRKTKQYMNNIAEAGSRMQTMRNAVSNSIEITDQMKSLLTVRRNPANADNIDFEAQMRNMRISLAKEMNTNFGGRYLFGGTRSDIAPVIDDPVPEAITPGVPDANYYQGSEQNIIIRPQDNFEMEFSVRADDPGYQKVFSAISLALKAHEQKDDTLLIQAINLLDVGKEEILAQQTRLDANIVDLKDITERHNSTFLYLKGVTEDIGQTNIVEASTQLAMDQAVLTASFQAFASVTNLRLVDFLR